MITNIPKEMIFEILAVAEFTNKKDLEAIKHQMKKMYGDDYTKNRFDKIIHFDDKENAIVASWLDIFEMREKVKKLKNKTEKIMKNDSNYIWIYLTSFKLCFSALRAICNQEKYRDRKWKVRRYYDEEKVDYRFSVHEKVLE